MAVPTHNYASLMPNYGAQASNEDLGSASLGKKGHVPLIIWNGAVSK
jgi:hypothetical protein